MDTSLTAKTALITGGSLGRIFFRRRARKDIEYFGNDFHNS